MKRTLFMSSVYLILSGLIIFFADYLTTPFIQKLYGSGISLEIVVRIRYSISVILSAIVFFLFLRFWKKRKQNLFASKNNIKMHIWLCNFIASIKNVFSVFSNYNLGGYYYIDSS